MNERAAYGHAQASRTDAARRIAEIRAQLRATEPTEESPA